MGDKSKIEWVRGDDGIAGATWNPIRGVKGNWHCTHVSEGCRNCYAERMNVRFRGPRYLPGADTFRLDEKILEQPLRWKRPRRIFVCSMTDLFHEQIPDEWIDRIFAVMALASKHTFLTLTKRPTRMRNYFNLSYLSDVPLAEISAEARIARYAERIAKRRGENTEAPYWDVFLEQPYSNIWLGVSVENQPTIDERVGWLLQTPATVRFVSYEPALGPGDFRPYLGECVRQWMPDDSFFHGSGLDWIIAGGESGPHARSSRPDWFRSVRDQCVAAGVPFFFKQWGEWGPSRGKYIRGPIPEWRGPNEWGMVQLGKGRAGRVLDGKEWNEFPKTIYAERATKQE